ncbi:MAG: hypothetical protein ACYS26_12925 [Planctomycetota bacterium]
MKLRRSSPAPATLALGVLMLAAPGCNSTSGGAGQSGGAPPVAVPQPPPAWTGAFLEPALMVARRIEITGPLGLMDHCTTTQDPGRVVYAAETTERGFEQRLTRAPGLNELVQLRGSIDQWRLVATDLLILREDPTARTVSVRAEGDVFLNRGEDQQRDSFYELEVPVGAPAPIQPAGYATESAAGNQGDGGE